MERTTTSFSIEWLASASPLWLLLLTPILVIVLVVLYSPQLRRLPSRDRMVLLSIRLLFLLTAAVLLFRPRVEVVQQKEFGGRVLLVTDESPSMQMPSRYLPPVALESIRARSEGVSEDTVSSLVEIAWLLREMEGLQTEGFLSGNTYWSFLENNRPKLNSLLEAIPGAALEKAPDFAEGIRTLFSPEAAEESGVRSRTAVLSGVLAELIAELDLSFASEMDPAVDSDLSNRTRQELADDFVKNRVLEILRKEFPMQVFSSTGSMDLVESTETFLEEENKRPVDGVIFLTDGRSLADRGRFSGLLEQLQRQSVPVHAVVFGEKEEPPDLAVLSVEAPSIVLRGQPLEVRFSTKSFPAAPAGSSELIVAVNDIEVEKLPLPPGRPTWNSAVSVALPAEEQGGLLRLALPSAAEEITDLNNSLSADFRVREEPLRVLLVEDAPSWWSGHFQHTLRRMPWVEIFRIPVDESPPENVPFDVLVLSASQIVTNESGEKLLAVKDLFPGLPCVFLGNISVFSSSVPPSEKPSIPEHWTIDEAGVFSPVTANWASKLPGTPEESSGPESGGVWFRLNGEPAWWWNAGEDGIPAFYFHLSNAATPFPSVYEGDFSSSWSALISWIENFGNFDADTVVPQRVFLRSPFSILHRGSGSLDFTRPGSEKVSGKTLGRVGPWNVSGFSLPQPGEWRLSSDAAELANVVVLPSIPRLGHLAGDFVLLAELSSTTGGKLVSARHFDAILPWIKSSLNREVKRFIFSPWSSVWMLGFLLLLLLWEWVWRKKSGLL